MLSLGQPCHADYDGPMEEGMRAWAERGRHLVIVAMLELAQVGAQAAVSRGQLLAQPLRHLIGLHRKHTQAPPGATNQHIPPHISPTSVRNTFILNLPKTLQCQIVINLICS